MKNIWLYGNYSGSDKILVDVSVCVCVCVCVFTG